MSKKLEIGIGLTGVVIALAAWLFPMQSTHTIIGSSSKEEPFYKKILPAPSLLVSGVGARVVILKGPDGIDFTGAEVTETGAVSTIYIKEGQKVNLNLTGIGAKVFIQSELLPYIKVNNTATGASVYVK